MSGSSSPSSAQVDSQFVPRRRGDVICEELDGEAVIWDPCATSLYVLNPSATVVWNSIDGFTTVDSLARELGEVFGIDNSRMELDVLQVVRDFGEQGLLVGFAGEAPSPVEPAKTYGVETPDVPASASERGGLPRLLPQSATGCSAQALDRLGWAGIATLQFGDWLVNLRANSQPALDAVEAYLSRYVVPTVEGACQYSVVLHGDEQDAGSVGRPLSILYRGTCAAFRSQYPAEVLFALSMYLAEHADSHMEPLRARSTILVGDDGQVHLLPDSLRREAALRKRRLADAGLYVAQNALAVLVPGTSEVSLRGGDLEVEVSVLSSVDPAGATRVEQHREPVGHYPIRRWLVPGPGEPLTKVSPGEAVRRLAAMVEPVVETDRRMLLDTLATIARSADVSTVGSEPGALLEALTRKVG